MTEKDLAIVFPVAWMLFGIYVLVLVAILADLWSGVRKAKQRGEVRSSEGFKRTVDKIARYYNALLALTVVDCMQMCGVWYLDVWYDYHLPVIPFVTIIGAIGFGLIEIKSIYEKAEDKVKYDYRQIGVLMAEALKHKTDPAEIAKAFAEYMNKEERNETK